MTLENILGNLRDAYQQIQPDTMLHVYDLTIRRTGPESRESRNLWFYSADGQLFTIDEEGRALWGITCRSQNLVLKHLDKAYAQLTADGNNIPNYIPDTEEAQDCFRHPDTVVVDLNKLNLKPICGKESGYFVVDSKKNLEEERNKERKRAMMRIFGPDEENYCKNMKMFAEAGISPYIFVLTPGYVRLRLGKSNAEYLARASCLANFKYSSNFDAGWNDVNGSRYVCGVRASDGKQETSAGRNAQKNDSSRNNDLSQKQVVVGRVAKISPKLKLI